MAQPKLYADDFVPVFSKPTELAPVPGNVVVDDFVPTVQVPDAATRNPFERWAVDPVMRGVHQAGQQIDTARLLAGGMDADDYARSVFDHEMQARKYPMHPDDAAAMQRIGDTEGWDQVMAALQSPGLWAQLAAQSTPQVGATVGAGVLGGLAAGPVGAVVGAGGASFASEFAASVLDAVRETGRAGSPEELAAAIRDPELMALAKDFAVKRGVSVAAFDAISFGLAGKLYGPTSRTAGRVVGTTAGKVAGGAAELGAQAGFGGIGEIAAQLASKGEVHDPGVAVLEATAEIPASAAIEIPGAVVSRLRNGSRATQPIGAEPQAQPFPQQAPMVDPAKIGTLNNQPDDFVPVMSGTPQPVGAQSIEPSVVTPQADPNLQINTDPLPTSGEYGADNLPVQQVQPQQVQVQPGPGTAQGPVQVTQVPASPAQVPASVEPTPVVQAPAQASTPATVAAPVETPAAPTQAAPAAAPVSPDAPRAAPEERTSQLRLGHVRRKAMTDLPKQGGVTRKTVKETMDRLRGMEVAREDETPQQFRIGDEVTLKGGYARGTVLGVTNSKGNVSLSLLMYDGKVRSLVKADDVHFHDRLAQDDPGPVARPDWYGSTVDNEKLNWRGIKPGDTVTDGKVRGKVVGVWQSKNTVAGQKRRAVNVAFQPEGQPDGTYRTASIDNVQPASAQAETAPAPVSPKAEPRATPELLPGEQLPPPNSHPSYRNTVGNGKRSMSRRKANKGVGIDKGYIEAVLPDGRKVAFWKNEGHGGTAIDGEYMIIPLDASGRELRYSPSLDQWGRNDGTAAFTQAELREKFESGQLDRKIDQLFDYVAQTDAKKPTADAPLADAAERAPDVDTDEDADVVVAPEDPDDLLLDEDFDGDDDDAALDLDDDEFADADDILGDDRKPSGTLTPQTIDVSFTNAASVNEEAWRLAGLTPDEGMLLPPMQKMNILRRIIMQTFGFLNVDFGGRGRQIAVNDGANQMLDAYRNVRWMMNVLGLPVQGVSLSGTLNLSLEKFKGQYFGAYSPGTNTIHMPGRSNSFAHEWFHALDHWLMKRLVKNPKLRNRLLSSEMRQGSVDPTQSLEAAFVNLFNTVFYDKAALAMKALELRTRAAATNAAGKPTPDALTAAQQLERLERGASRLDIDQTDFVKNTRDYDPAGAAYWTSPEELLARAFEAYIAARMEAAGANSNAFVTKGDAAYLSDADRRLEKTFPKAGDRLRIFSAFDDLFEQLRQQQMLGTGPAADAPTGADTLDPQAWNKQLMQSDGPNLNPITELKQTFGALRNAVRSPKAAGSSFVQNMGVNTEVGARKAARGLADFGRYLVFSLRGYINPMIKRNMGRGGEYMKAAWDMFNQQTGAGGVQDATFSEERGQNYSITANKVHAEMKNTGLERITKDVNDRLRRLLFGEQVANATANEKKLAATLRRVMNDLHQRAVNAGLSVGFVKDKGYLPRVTDTSKVQNDPFGFEKAATRLYKIVFDNEYGDAEARTLMGLAKRVEVRAEAPGMFAKEMDAVRRARRAQKRAEQKVAVAAADVKAAKTPQEAQAAAARAAKAAAAKKQADAAMQRATDDLRAAIKPVWSQHAAEDWRNRVVAGNSLTFDSLGPTSNFTKARELPPEADAIMADWYKNDVIELVMEYAQHVENRSAYVERVGNGSNRLLSTVLARADVKNRLRGKYDPKTVEGRIAIIKDLTNPAADNRLEMLLREAERAGAFGPDVEHLRGAVQLVTGRATQGPLATPLNRITAIIYSLGHIMLLPRAAWTALAEPASIIMQTGSFRAGAKTLVSYLGEALRGMQSTKERAALARAIGIVTTPLYDMILQNRLSMDHDRAFDGVRILGRTFSANALAPLTNAQARAGMAGGFLWMQDLARKHQKLRNSTAADSRIEQRKVEAEFTELGVPEADLKDFMDWLAQGDDLPSLDSLDTKAGRLFQKAMYRFVDRIRINPDRTDKPLLASTAYGRVVFSLTGFVYGFFAHVHAATISRMKRDYGIAVDEGASKAAAAFGSVGPHAFRFAVGFATIIFAQFLTTIVRELIFNSEQWEEKEDEERAAWLTQLAFSRSGILGPGDIVMNSITGLRYERDLSNLFVGPGGGYILNNAANILRGMGLTDRNTPNSNSAEREMWKSVYRLTIAPATTVALGALDVFGPMGWATRYGALTYGSSSSAADDFATWLAGEPKRLKKGDEGYVPSARSKEKEGNRFMR